MARTINGQIGTAVAPIKLLALAQIYHKVCAARIFYIGKRNDILLL